MPARKSRVPIFFRIVEQGHPALGGRYRLHLNRCVILMTTPQEFHLDLLQKHAREINAMCRRGWFARPFYEYMSGGLIWTDETNVSGEMLDALRLLFHCRTQLIMQSPQKEWAEYWAAAHKIAPNWVGFHANRCAPTEKLRKLVLAGEKRLEADLAQLDCDTAYK